MAGYRYGRVSNRLRFEEEFDCAENRKMEQEETEKTDGKAPTGMLPIFLQFRLCFLLFMSRYSDSPHRHGLCSGKLARRGSVRHAAIAIMVYSPRRPKFEQVIGGLQELAQGAGASRLEVAME